MEIIDTDALQAALATDRFYLLDCSYFTDTNSRAKHFEARIQGAKFFDCSVIRDTTVSHPMQLPTLEQFTLEMRKLRVKNDGTPFVLYDQTGMFGIGRTFWMLKYYGFTGKVRVLWGGLPKWLREGKPVETGEYQVEGQDDAPEGYKFALNPFMLVTLPQLNEMLPGIQSGQSQVQLWDTRVDKLYADGQIPGHIHIVFRPLLDENWTFKSKEEVRQILTAQGLDLSRPVITMCRSGVVAAICYLLLHYIDKADIKMYAGSWLEYKAALPVVNP